MLGKNPENLTDKQQERLSVIQAEDGPMNRAHVLKEQLRLILHMDDAETAAACLDKWTSHARRCRIPSFVELQRKIRRHREHILNAIRHGVSNARIEALNNKIKLLIRIAYGFRNIDTMISLVMPFCSNIRIPWPSSNAPMTINKGLTAQEAAWNDPHLCLKSPIYWRRNPCSYTSGVILAASALTAARSAAMRTAYPASGESAFMWPLGLNPWKCPRMS